MNGMNISRTLSVVLSRYMMNFPLISNDASAIKLDEQSKNTMASIIFPTQMLRLLLAMARICKSDIQVSAVV
jgi:hypothetical protein